MLIKDGKGNWIERREDHVEAKGKGVMTTYWLRCNYLRHKKSSNAEGSYTSDLTVQDDLSEDGYTERTNKL